MLTPRSFYAVLIAAAVIAPAPAFALKLVVETRSEEHSRLPRWDDTYNRNSGSIEAIDQRYRDAEKELLEERAPPPRALTEADIDALVEKKLAEKAAKDKAPAAAPAKEAPSPFGPVGGLGAVGGLGDVGATQQPTTVQP